MAALWITVFVFLHFSSFSCASKDEYHEELLIKPLPTGHVYTYFQFTTLWDVDIKDHEACKYGYSARHVKRSLTLLNVRTQCLTFLTSFIDS